jgi:large subunit ribosomal protein L35
LRAARRQAKKERRSHTVPKVKSKKSAAKRFKIRSSGGIKRSQAYMRHILTKKSTKRKRHLRGTTEVHATNKRAVRAMLPYAS